MRFLAGLVPLMAAHLSMAQFGEAREIHPLGNAPSLEAHDLEGDGDTDLIGLTPEGSVLAWRNTDGAGNFGAVDTLFSLATTPVHWLFVDLNGNGAVDLLFIEPSSGQLHVAFDLDLAPSLTTTLADLMPDEIGALKAADLNADGIPEPIITWHDGSTGGIMWWPSSGTNWGDAMTVEGLFPSQPPSVMACGDLDGSGSVDVLMVREDLAAIGLMNNSNGAGGWDVLELFFNFDYPFEDPQLIDVDGDGDLDLAEAGALAVQWAENRLDGGSLWPVRVLEPFTTAGVGAFAPLGCGAGAGVVMIPSNPGLPVRWSHFVTNIHDLAPRSALPGVARGRAPLLADMDGNGRADLIVCDDNGARWHPNLLQAPTTNVVLPSFEPLCILGPSFPLPAAEPLNGTWSGTWVQNGELFRANASGSTLHPVNYTFYEPEGCPVGDQAQVQLINGPTISPALGPILCSAQRPVALQADPANVQWTGLPPNGILDPATYTGQLIAAAYIDPTGVPCASFIGPIAVWPSVPAHILPAGPFCINDGPQTILPEVNVQGSTWSGDIVSSTNNSAVFDPSLGAGTYQVVLSRVPTMPQQCGNSDTLTIDVFDDIPSVSLAPLPIHCATDAMVTLTGGQPQGGVWSGPGVTNSLLDPTAVGPGDHVVSYTVTMPSGCSASATTLVQLWSNAIIAPGPRAFCPDEPAYTFLAQPPGGVWDDPLSPEGVLDPSQLGVSAQALVYRYTAPNGCVLINAPDSVRLKPVTEVTINLPARICVENGPFLLEGSPAGDWTGAATGTGSQVLVDPNALGVGEHSITLTATDNDACTASLTLDLVIEVCTGMEERALPMARVHPNPAIHGAWVEVGHSMPLDWALHDAQGRLLTKGRWNPGPDLSHYLDLEGFVKGTYILVLTTERTAQPLRIIKE